MGHASDVFGCILCDGSFSEENAERMRTLPETDTWPALTRDMFAVPSMEYSYLSQLVSFGRTYKNVEIAWETWLSKFEALLRTLYWNDAHVYLRTECWGSFHYRWVPATDIEPNAPVQIWTFSGGPRSGIRDEYRKSDEVGW